MIATGTTFRTSGRATRALLLALGVLTVLVQASPFVALGTSHGVCPAVRVN